MKIGEKIEEYIRVLKLAKKPSKEEFRDILRVCLIGILFIGVVGFVVYLVSVLFGL